jgi:hypothetical protein
MPTRPARDVLGEQQALALVEPQRVLTALAPGTSVAFLLSAYAVFGFGFALVNPAIANAAVSGMPPAQAGVAAAVATTTRQAGITLGAWPSSAPWPAPAWATGSGAGSRTPHGPAVGSWPPWV